MVESWPRCPTFFDFAHEDSYLPVCLRAVLRPRFISLAGSCAVATRSSLRTLASPSVLIFRLSRSSLSLKGNLCYPLREACRVVVVCDRQHRWPPVRESNREMASRGLASSKQIVRKAGSRLNFQRKVYDYSSVGAHSYRIERITSGGRS